MGPARPSVLEKVDEVLRGHRREAAVRVSGRAGVARVLWEGQGVTTRAGREDSSEVTRHSLKCTWTPPHRYADSKRELGTRGCSVRGGQGGPESGGQEEPMLPCSPALTPSWSPCPLRPRWVRIHSGTVLGTTHPCSPKGPAPHPPAETPRAHLCQNSLRTWGPVRPVSGDGTPSPAKPTPSFWSKGSSWDPDGGQVGRPVTRQQRPWPHRPSPPGDAHRLRQRGGTSSNKARRQSWRWRRRRAVKGGKKGKQG